MCIFYLKLCLHLPNSTQIIFFLNVCYVLMKKNPTISNLISGKERYKWKKGIAMFSSISITKMLDYAVQPLLKLISLR